MSDLQQLSDRLARATGPDRELDLEIQNTFSQPCDFSADWGRHSRFTSFPYTASIDAALALVERLLPGWIIAFEKGKTSSACRIRECFGSDDTYEEVSFGSPTLAILRALVAALMASGNEASYCDCDNGRVQFTNGVPCPKCRKSTSSDVLDVDRAVLDSIDVSGNEVEDTKS